MEVESTLDIGRINLGKYILVINPKFATIELSARLVASLKAKESYTGQ